MRYKAYINNTDVTNYIYCIETIKERKEIDDNVLTPEYEFTFGYFDWLDKNRSVSPFSNIDFVGIPFRFEEMYTNDVIISGVIKDIQITATEITVIVTVKNSDYLSSTVNSSYISLNPCEIIKNICDEFFIPCDERSYKKIYKETEGTYYTLIAGDLTVQDVLTDLAKKACIQIFFTGGKLYFDSFNPYLKNNLALTLTDDDIYNDIDLSQNNYEDLVYTNFQFKTAEIGDVLLYDEDGINYGKSMRSKLGNKPYDELDGSTSSNIRIDTAFSGFYNLLNYIRFYGRYFKIIEIKLNLQKYNAFRLDTIFAWNSKKFNLYKKFEVREIERNYKENYIKITAWEIETIVHSSLISGFGITSYGSNYGN